MFNRDFRWLAGFLLLALFGVLSYGGGATPKAQTSQNVLVTNSPAQSVPVLPAARPYPGGAYVVTVANAPSVRVVSSTTAPVVTKDGNNPDAHGATTFNGFSMPTGITDEADSPLGLSSLPVVIDAISVSGASSVANECIDSGDLLVFSSGSVELGDFAFTIPYAQNGNVASAYLGTVHVPVPPNGTIVLLVRRHGGSTGSCQVKYSLAYHTVPNP